MRLVRKFVSASAAFATVSFPMTPLSARSDARGARTEEVRIVRDEYGVPHVFASTVHGLFYGFGAALGDDQLYKMEILKRTAEGRVAEVLGPSYIDYDRTTRQRVDLTSLQRQFDVLAPADQAIFQGIADGLNQRVDAVRSDEALLPKGFVDNGFMPEHWAPVDIAAIYVHSMALRFSDINSELDNLALLTRLRTQFGPQAGWRLFEQLRWVSDDAAPTTITKSDQHDLPTPTFATPAPASQLPNGLKPLAISTLYPTPASVAATSRPGDVPHASNAWLASSRLLGPGRAVLVNGPQMGDFAAAYIWAIGLHGAGFNVVGSGPVGSPWLIFGSNGDIGWGATAGLGDTVDIYQERLDPKDPHRYVFKGRSLPMARRDETIKVKGGASFTMTIYSTVHGPVDLFDVDQGVVYARRRSWAGSELSSLVAWVHAMQARNYAQWRASVAKVAVTVNNYYADKDGNIAYQFLGRFPIRPAGQDFRLPVTGDGSMEWRGTYSPLRNPYILNPTSGFLANWNNKPQPSYHNSDFMFWSRVDRVNEIQEQLRGLKKVTPETLWSVIERTSFKDTTARYFVELIRAQRTKIPAAGPSAEASAMLAAWDGTVTNRATGRATPEYVLYKAFLARLLDEIFTPILPNGAGRQQAEKDYLHFDPVFPSLGVKIAYTTLASGDPGNLLQGKAPYGLLDQALSGAMTDTVGKFGRDPAQWNEPAPPHRFVTENYAGIPESVDPTPPSLPVLLNRGSENDLIVFDKGRMSYCDVTPPGASGFIDRKGNRSPHYADQIRLYATFGCKPQWLDAATIKAHARSEIRLTVQPNKSATTR